MKLKHKGTIIEKSAAGEGHDFIATFTSDALDRDGEVLVPSGMDATEYEKNPILLWMHDKKMPVGHCVGLIRGEKSNMGRFKFSPRPEGYVGEWFPDFIKGLTLNGTVRALSVGYDEQPGGTRSANHADLLKYGPACHTIYGRWTLLENSLVTVGANPEALVEALGKGLVTKGAVDQWGDLLRGSRDAAVGVETVRTITVPRIGAIEKSVSRRVAKARGELYDE